jgi:hypothetical protein
VSLADRGLAERAWLGRKRGAELGRLVPVGREPEGPGQVLPARVGDPDHPAPVGAPYPAQREQPVGQGRAQRAGQMVLLLGPLKELQTMTC